VFTSDAYTGPRFLAPDLRGSKWIRPNLYERGRSWSDFRNPIVASEKIRIRNEVKAANASLDVNAWLRLHSNHEIPDDATIGKFTEFDVDRTRYELDHIESVYEHWNAKGNRIDDSQRQTFYFTAPPNGTRVVTREFNQARETESYVHYVEASFTTLIAEGGRQGAKSIQYRNRHFQFLDGLNGEPVK
jgi:hypothetical protein